MKVFSKAKCTFKWVGVTFARATILHEVTLLHGVTIARRVTFARGEIFAQRHYCCTEGHFCAR